MYRTKMRGRPGSRRAGISSTSALIALLARQIDRTEEAARAARDDLGRFEEMKADVAAQLREAREMERNGERVSVSDIEAAQ